MFINNSSKGDAFKMSKLSSKIIIHLKLDTKVNLQYIFEIFF